MAQLDDYLRSMVAPNLHPGESILGFAHLRRHTGKNSDGTVAYEEWLATATSARLILFRTVADGVMEITPRAQCLEAREWRYGDLREVGTFVRFELHMTTWNGRPMFLTPHEALGPYDGESQRYDLFPMTRGLDGHLPFYNNFPKWLEGEVARGAYPMDANGRAVQERLRQKREADAAWQAGMRVRQAAASKRTMQRGWPHMMAAGMLLVAALLGVMTANTAENASHWRNEKSIMAKELAILQTAVATWVQAGTPPPTDCPEQLSKSRLALQHQCHGCDVSGMPPRTGQVVHKRGEVSWVCDSAFGYQFRIDELRKRMKAAEADADTQGGESTLFGILCAAMVLGAVGLAVWGVIRAKRLSAAEVQPGGGAQPASVQ